MTVPPGSLTARYRPERPWIQLTVGVTAVTVTAALGALLHFRPGPNAADRLGFLLIPPSTNSWFFHMVTWLGTMAALVIGSVGAAAVARFAGRRDRFRALACLISPPAAAAINQFLTKPVVGRPYQGEISFASGSVTVIAGVSAAWVLAVPRRIRPVASVLGVLGVATMVVAVIALQWHFPTDALAGALFGVGMVLMVDSVTRIRRVLHDGMAMRQPITDGEMALPSQSEAGGTPSGRNHADR